MDKTITLILHHGGKLVIEDDKMSYGYYGGEMCVWEDIECDRFNIFDIENMAKKHGYHKFEKIWWRNPHADAIYKLRQIVADTDILDMCIASRHNNDEIDIYYEHPMIIDDPVVEDEITGQNDETVEEVEIQMVGLSDDEDFYNMMQGSGNESQCRVNEEEVAEEMNDEQTNEEAEGGEEVNVVQQTNEEAEHVEEVNVVEQTNEEAEHSEEEVAEDIVNEINNDADSEETEDETLRNRRVRLEKKRGKGKGKKVMHGSVEGGSKRKRKQVIVAESSETEGGESDTESDTLYEPTPVEQQDWSLSEGSMSYHSEELHSPVSSGDEEYKRSNALPQFNPDAGFGTVHLEIGMEFTGLESFKNAAKDNTIEKGRPIKWVKNDKVRARGKWRANNCT